MRIEKILDNAKRKRIVFLILNLFFWFVILVREYISYVYYIDSGAKGFILPLITIIIGFLFTFIIRIVFIKRISKLRSEIKLLLIYFLVILMFSVLWVVIDHFLSFLFASNSQREIINQSENLIDQSIRFAFFYVVTYMIWGAIYLIFFLWEKYMKQYIQTQKAINYASKAKFQMLQNQLNPHFLFNSMNSVRALVYEDKNKASEMVTKLSDFLRYNLNQGPKVFIRFDQELEAIKNYLAIEKIRFENDIEINYDIDPECHGVLVVPNLLLPVVDNAVKYGIKTSPEPLMILLKAKKIGHGIDIEVINTGNWIEGQQDSEENTGKGLNIVKERLRNIFGDDFDFVIDKGIGSVKVRIRIPGITDEIIQKYNY